MIKIIVQGGLGNQMFQYITAYSLAKKNKDILLLARKDKLKLNKYFKSKDDIKFNYILGYICAFQRKFYNKKYLQFFKIKTLSKNKEPKVLINDCKDGDIIQSTFNSLEFFENSLTELNYVFEIRKKYIDVFRDLIIYLNPKKKPYIAIHFRRKDYKTFGKYGLGSDNLVLPIDYYINCLNNIPNIKDYKIIAVGDDINEIKNININIDYDIIYQQNEEIIDFQILKNADIVIAANSTYSFWASLLNKKAKLVFLPNYWLGFHVKSIEPKYIFNLLPDNFKIQNF